MLKSSDLCPDHLAGEQDALFQADISFYHSHLNEFELVSCPACHSSLPSSSFVKEGLVYLKCSKCSTIYMNPRPSQSLMNRFYEQSQNYQIWAEKIFPQTDQTRIEKLHLPRLERIKHLASSFGQTINDLKDGQQVILKKIANLEKSITNLALANKNKPADNKKQQPPKADPNKVYNIEIGDSFISGPENAKVTIIEWMDFQ